jgi:hypothetical protein
LNFSGKLQRREEGRGGNILVVIMLMEIVIDQKASNQG